MLSDARHLAISTTLVAPIGLPGLLRSRKVKCHRAAVSLPFVWLVLASRKSGTESRECCSPTRHWRRSCLVWGALAILVPGTGFRPSANEARNLLAAWQSLSHRTVSAKERVFTLRPRRDGMLMAQSCSDFSEILSNCCQTR